MKKTSFLMAIVIVLSFVFTGCSNHSQADDILSMETLNGNTYNLVDAIYEKGAHFVLGTTNSVYTSDSNRFLAGFIEKLNAGENIYNCFYEGLVKAGKHDKYKDNDNPEGYYPIIYVGDTRQYLN